MDRFCKECSSRLKPEYDPERKGFFNMCRSHKTYGRVALIENVRDSKDSLAFLPRDCVRSSLFKKTFMMCETCKKETECTEVVRRFSDMDYVYLCHECVLGKS